MEKRPQQPDATPLILPKAGASAKQLERIPLGDPPFREERLQELLAAHPRVLPVSEIEPAYAPLVYLGREIPTPSGFLDALYVSPKGYLTLVEAKLWDSPEARRQVVGQIVEYAKDLSHWGFEELDNAVRQADDASNGLLERVRQQGHDVDATSFIDTVTRTLQRGEVLLLIVGDGIRKNLEALSSYLQDAPNLHFSLRLVELALFRLQSDNDRPLLIQPRVVARTSEVTRAVVDVQAPNDVDVTVELPEEEEDDSSSRQQLTETAFFEQLADNTSSETVDEVRALIDDITALGPVRVWRSSSVSLRLPDPGGLDRHWTVIVLWTEGSFELGWLGAISADGGYDPEIWKSYLDTVVDLTGVTAAEKHTKVEPIQSLLHVRKEYVDTVRRFVKRLRSASNVDNG